MNDYLHIVCLDAPAPPDYGGAIDMYYKIKALASLGKKIILHYFDYKQHRSAGNLSSLCAEVHAYKREKIQGLLSAGQPYIIASRTNKKLVSRLNSDHYPVLLEGLHCAGLIPLLNSPQRIVLRMHNEESNYYKQLANAENRWWKKAFFNRESALLQYYQQGMNKDIKIAALSQLDGATLKENYGFRNLHLIPCFTAWQYVDIQPGKGEYCLYHGNMSVSENEAAVLWLIEQVFSKLALPFVIAGKGIRAQVKKAAEPYQHISIKHNPTTAELDALIKEAQVNVLPSLNNTGVKLKLLHALLKGRFCLTNTAGVAGSGIASGVIVADDPELMIENLTECFQKVFTQEMAEERKQVAALYNNKINAGRLAEIFDL